MSDNPTSRFCIEGKVPLKCKFPVFQEFGDPIDTFKIVLAYFKEYLPFVMAKKMRGDVENEPIKIDPRDVDVTTQKDYGDFLVIIVPTDDNSTYSGDIIYTENTNYVFQAHLETRHEDSEVALEHMWKLQAGVKTLLVNMDTNLGLDTEPSDFSLGGPFGPRENKSYYQGTYPFSVRFITTKR